jgi:hypothetical protein
MNGFSNQPEQCADDSTYKKYDRHSFLGGESATLILSGGDLMALSGEQRLK